MSTKVIIMFPYSGYEEKEPREELFWSLVDCSVQETKEAPIVVLNQDTERRGKAQAFLNDRRLNSVVLQRCWAVDTCQMWLAGWGHVIDNYPNGTVDRIVQIPGDIDKVSGSDGTISGFFNQLEGFINRTGRDIYIGDFKSEDRFSAKELIDLYGTYALMANWFPDIAQSCRRTLELNKLRSEFLNIKIETLKKMLIERKFAYEQTLNMIIRSWDFEKQTEDHRERGAWKYEIKRFDLGILRDDSRSRQYRDCLDQIERTERMLKMLWREFNEVPEELLKTNSWEYEKKYQEYIDLYDRLDRRSTSIRENARIIIRNILGLGPKISA